MRVEIDMMVKIDNKGRNKYEGKIDNEDRNIYEDKNG